MPSIKTNSLLTKTQADGAESVDLLVFDSAKLHQMQVIASAVPAAGILTVAIKTPGASTYSNLPWTIDLTSLATNSVFQFYGFVESIVKIVYPGIPVAFACRLLAQSANTPGVLTW